MTGVRAILLVCALAQVTFAQNQAAKESPPQPIPFSHKLHAGTLKTPCKMCHPGPDPGEVMTLPEASKCMECHSAIKKDSPAIQKLAAYSKTDREIDWVRIYQIPTYVIFSHKTHIDSGAKCQECHGPVEERDRLFRETDISMGGCMSCHRAKRASIDCTTCHDQLR